VKPPTPRYLTVPSIAAELKVSPRTVWRAIKATTDDVIPRQRVRIPAGANRRMMMQIVADVNSVDAYLDTPRT